jgi:hypothetical protein
VLGGYVDGEDFMRPEESRERTLRDRLPALAPFGPWTALDPGQFVYESPRMRWLRFRATAIGGLICPVIKDVPEIFFEKIQGFRLGEFGKRPHLPRDIINQPIQRALWTITVQ